MAVNERQREIGLLRAMGARRQNIFNMITIEAALLSLVGGIVGILAGGGLLLLCKEPLRLAFKLPYIWPDARYVAFAAVLSLCVALARGVAAAAWPAYRSSRMEPYLAIRKGE